MKKITALIASSFLLLLPALSLAATCTVNCHEVSENIQYFDNYLNGKLPPPNIGFIPGDKINEELKASLTNAKTWHSDAYLANFTYTYAPGSEDNYVFDWISPSDSTKMYEQRNSETVGQEMTNIYKTPYGIFHVALTMRKLTNALLKDSKTLSTLDSFFGNSKSGAITVMRFSLQKNSNNQLGWTVTTGNNYTQKMYLLKVDADKIQSPVFNILEGK